MVRSLKQLVRKGELGKIQQLHFEMPQEGFVRPPDIGGQPSPPQAWRLRDGAVPMICHDLGTHLYHLAWFVTGQTPHRVMADYAGYAGFVGVIDDVRIWTQYAEGMRGAFWFSKSAIGCRNGMKLRLFGDKASAEWLQTDPETLKISYLDGRVCLLDRAARLGLAAEAYRYNRMKPGHPAGFIEAFANLYGDIADELLRYQSAPEAWSGFASDFVTGLTHSSDCLQFFETAAQAQADASWVDVKGH